VNKRFEQIVKLFQKLPGVGPRQAARFVLALLEKDERDLKELGQAIVDLKSEINLCPQCFNITNNGLCEICSSTQRDKAQIMVVEKVTDLSSVERSGVYKGLYHVLGGAINPLEKRTPDSLNINSLQTRLAQNPSNKIELIIATNPGTAGEATTFYLKDRFGSLPNVEITTLGRGLSSGSMLEYADEATLKHALEKRS